MPEFKSLRELDQRLAHPVMMLGADPPDDVVHVPVPMYIFRGQLGLTHSAHAGDHLRMRRDPIGEVFADQLDLARTTGEIPVRLRNLLRPDPLGQPGWLDGTVGDGLTLVTAAPGRDRRAAGRGRLGCGAMLVLRFPGPMPQREELLAVRLPAENIYDQLEEWPARYP